MADYYPVLVRAISRLEVDNALARQELYDHARAFLVAQLREREPRRSALGIMSEQAALERTIRRLESRANVTAEEAERLRGNIETRRDRLTLNETKGRLAHTPIKSTPARN